MDSPGDMFGLYALSSAISSHLITRHHMNVEKSWYENKWFWAGLFGNLPALLAIVAHVYFLGTGGEERTE
jgi:hypothetical protein